MRLSEETTESGYFIELADYKRFLIANAEGDRDPSLAGYYGHEELTPGCWAARLRRDPRPPGDVGPGARSFGGRESEDFPWCFFSVISPR
jgi:hypothetical protein